MAPEFNRGTLEVDGLLRDNEFYSGVCGLIEEYNKFCVYYLEEMGRLNLDYKNHLDNSHEDEKDALGVRDMPG